MIKITTPKHEVSHEYDMASHTLRILLRQHFGIDVLTFEQTPVQPFGQPT